MGWVVGFEAPLKTYKLLILKAQKTHRTQETLVSLRSYYDRTGKSDLAVIPSVAASAQDDEAAPCATIV